MLALGVAGGRVVMVDEATGEVKWAVQAHAGEEAGTQVAMSPNGRFVATVGSAEENWRLWDAASGTAWMAAARHDGTGSCTCAVDDQGHRSLQEGCPVAAHTAGLRALAFSPCGQRIASAGDDGVVILWDAQTGRAERRMEGGSDRGFMSLSFSADGERVASGGGAKSIHVWDTATGALARTIPQAHTNFVPGVRFSPTDSRILASAGIDGLILLWDVDSGEKIKSFEGCALAVLSPDGFTIATARASVAGDISTLAGDVLLIDVETGTVRVRLSDHRGYVSTASFSTGGSKIASGSLDGTCKVWDTSTGALLRTIELGAGHVMSVSWGRDWVRDTQTGVAFAMGHHPRLGDRSQVQGLDPGVVRMILDRT